MISPVLHNWIALPIEPWEAQGVGPKMVDENYGKHSFPIVGSGFFNKITYDVKIIIYVSHSSLILLQLENSHTMNLLGYRTPTCS